MAKVQGYTEDDLDILIADFEGVVEDSLRSVAVRVASQLRPAIVAASSAGLGPQDVMVASQYWQEEVDGVITPYIAEVYTGSAVQVAIGIGDAFPDDAMPGIPLVADEFAVTYMKTVQNRLSGVGDEVWEDIRNELLDGIHNGDSVEQIADRISNLANFEETRAKRIARTEVHAAAESGSIAQMQFMGYDKGTVTKEWVSTRDGRTRETHRFANGQIVQLDESFLVGLSHLQFPGDPTGAPGEIINCRCTTIFEIDEEPKYRCDSSLASMVAATAGDSTHCVLPTPHADISGIGEALREALFTAFMAAKISPAYGGAKIHKVLAQVREEIEAGHLTDFQILQVVDQKYAKGSFLGKYTEWLQTPAGQKATGGLTLPKKATHVVAPTDIDLTTPPAAAPLPVVEPASPGFAPLPPVPAKPKISDLTFTGKVFNTASKAQVWIDSNGQKWLFKPIKGQSYSAKFLVEIDLATSRIASKALMQRPGIYEINLDGKHGTLQSMFDSTEAFPGGSFDPLKLSAEDLLVMQREQIFDWLISNHDTHSGQWIRLSTGQLVGIDKGQSFKFFPNDKLSWDYVPVTPLGADKLTYSTMWKAFIQGKDIDLQDPTQGPLGEYMARLMAIPDDEYKALLRPYAESRAKTLGGDVEAFLDAAVKRKHDLQKDFSAFWAKALKARQAAGGSAPPPKGAAKIVPKKVEPTPQPQPAYATAPSLPATGPELDLGDISGVSLSAKQAIMSQWIALGGGKKVTPAWGGSKIWKMLQELKASSDVHITPLNHLQLLRILDEMGGFKGKPKTYESILIDWLESPAGMKVVKPGAVTSLKKTLAAPSATATKLTPAPKPKPAESWIDGKNAGEELTHGELQFWFNNEGKPDSIGAEWTDAGFKYHLVLKFNNEGTAEVWTEMEADGKWIPVEKMQTLPPDFVSIFKPVAVAKDLKAPTPVAPVMPLAAPMKTVGGMLPGTSMTTKQIQLSLGFDIDWEHNDILAVAKSADGLYDYRIIYKSDAPSHYIVQMKLASSKSWNDSAASLDDAWVTAAKWEVPGVGTSAVPEKKALAKIYGKAPGESVTVQEMNQSKHLWKFNDVVAEADDAFTAAKWRVVIDEHGEFLIQFKAPLSTVWGNTEHTLESLPQAWKLTGDVLIGGKTKSKLPGKNVGDKLTNDDVWDLAWGSVGPGDVFAYTWDDVTGTMYRLKIEQGTGDMMAEWLQPNGTWEPAYYVTDKIDLPSSTTWYAAHPTKLEIPDPLKVYVEPAPVKYQAKKTAKKAAKAAPLPISKVPLTGVSTHIPGKIVGDSVDATEILAHAQKYADGEIVAQYTTKGWNKTSYRLVWTNEGLVKQKQTSSGAWKSEDVIDVDWKLYGKWEAANGLATKPQITAIKKFIAKKGSPPTPKVAKKAYTPPTPYVAPTPSPLPTLTQGQLAHVDLTPWDDTERAEIVDYLAGLNPNSSPELVWGKLQQAKSHFAAKYKGKYLGLNELEILRMLDAANAKKGGKVDLHLIEAKIVNWLQTPAGKYFTSRRIDAPIQAPDVPIPMSAYADYPDPDTQKYDVISTSQALAYRAESHAKYGGFNPGEQAATKVYTGGSYTSWNDAIRKGDLGSYKSNIYKTQRGMRPSTRPMLLHRGTSFLEFNDPSITSYETLLPYVGRTYVNRGFNSTSVGGNPAFSGQLLIEYEAPAGTPMSYVADFSHHPGEREMLLPTHMTYQIISVTKKNEYTTVMRVRVLGPATP